MVHEIVVPIQIDGHASGCHHLVRYPGRVGTADTKTDHALVIQLIKLKEIRNKPEPMMGKINVEGQIRAINIDFGVWMLPPNSIEYIDTSVWSPTRLIGLI